MGFEHDGRSAPRGEAMSAAIAAGIAGIVSPVAGAILGGAAAVFNAKRQAEWQRLVDERVQGLAADFDSLDEHFMGIFNTLTLGAMQATRHEKLVFLANAVGRSASGSSTPDFVQQRFARLLLTYTPEHINVLALIHNPVGWMRRTFVVPDFEQTIADVFREAIASPNDRLREDAAIALDSIFRELYADGLLDSIPGAPAIISEGGLSEQVSAQGVRFIHYVLNAKDL